MDYNWYYGVNILTKKENISQKVLELIMLKKAELQNKKENLSQLKNDIENIEILISDLENKIIYHYKAGHKVSLGKYILSIGFKLLMPRIAWKQEFIKVTNIQKAQELMDERIGENKEILIIERKNND